MFRLDMEVKTVANVPFPTSWPISRSKSCNELGKMLTYLEFMLTDSFSDSVRIIQRDAPNGGQDIK